MIDIPLYDDEGNKIMAYEANKDGSSNVLLKGSNGVQAGFTFEDWNQLVQDAKDGKLDFNELHDPSEVRDRQAEVNDANVTEPANDEGEDKEA